MTLPRIDPASLIARAPWLSPLVLCGLALLMLAKSWQRWSTPYKDLGREFYTAWAISEGASLYSDIWLPRGPLSSYANGLLFDVFGAGVVVLALANLLWIAIAAALLHREIRLDFGRGTAFLASFILLSVFVFARYGQHGNYNFVLPYAHEVTHGVGLSFAAMWLVLGATEGARVRFALAGVVLGLVCLTKQEVAVAACAATMCTLAFGFEWPTAARMRALAWIALGALLPLATAFLLLGPAPFEMMWNPSIGELVRANTFYRASLGLDRPVAHLLRMGTATLVCMIELGAIVLIGRRFSSARGVGPQLAALAFVAIQLALLWLASVSWTEIWADVPALLPSATFAVLLGCVHRVWGGRTISRVLLWLAVFAALMLVKLGLQPRFIHYGFAQAMPAALVVVIAGHGVLPAWLERRGVDRHFVRGVIACAVVGFGLYSVTLQWRDYDELHVAVGRGRDAFYVLHENSRYEQLLDLLQDNVAPTETLVVFPEGVLFNYLLRTENPTPHISFMPFEFSLTGEARILADLRSEPPDWVLLLDRSGAEYGRGTFGEVGWGGEIMDWLRARYIWPPNTAPGQPRLLRHRAR